MTEAYIAPISYIGKNESAKWSAANVSSELKIHTQSNSAIYTSSVYTHINILYTCIWVAHTIQ